jgi:hypothetical protein
MAHEAPTALLSAPAMRRQLPRLTPSPAVRHRSPLPMITSPAAATRTPQPVAVPRLPSLGDVLYRPSVDRGASPTDTHQSAVAARAQRDDKRLEALEHRLETLRLMELEEERQLARVAAAAKMRRTAQTIIAEWRDAVDAHPDTEADVDRQMRERADRRYRRAQTDAAAVHARVVEMTDAMGVEKRWRVPHGATAEVQAGPRVSCFPVAVLPTDTVVVELESRFVGDVLWVRTELGWIGTQFAHGGLVQAQLTPETERTDTTACEFMLEAKDHISDAIDRALDGCVVDRMMSQQDAKDLRVAAQRRRDELRAIHSGHFELIQQTWFDMQNSAQMRAVLAAGVKADDASNSGDDSADM